MTDNAAFLQVENLSKCYLDTDGSRVQAVSEVSLTIAEGEVFGLVGESGCGKSTLGRLLLRLIEPDTGQIKVAGQEIRDLSHQDIKSIRRDCQIIFQDPFGSLNPRHRVATIIGEPLIVHAVGNKTEREARVSSMLTLVGLPPDSARRFPHEFSGGQRQRIAIARALILNPRFLIADEAVSALDVSIQSQIINLIVELRQKMSLSMLFISHDLSVVRHVSDRIAVMYLGRIVEVATAAVIMDTPRHPYTQALISAIPSPHKPVHSGDNSTRIVLQGEMPDPANPPSGCAFHTRCPRVMAQCRTDKPRLVRRMAPAEPINQTVDRLADSAMYAGSSKNNVTEWEVACHLYPQA